jgi:hypothetical protein
MLGEVEIVWDPITLENLLRGPDGEVAKHMTNLMLKAVGYAQQVCPVDTGLLRSSIPSSSYVAKDSGDICAFVGSSVYYAIYVELGTMYMAAEPYIWPGVDYALNGNTLAIGEDTWDDPAFSEEV